MLLVALGCAAVTGNVRPAVDAALKAAETAVTLALGLVGVMALWLGVMRLAERAGLVAVLARLLRPVLVRLFPEVPPQHPAMGSMVLNLAANMLGLANAATPLGLRAMRDLETLNRHPGTATNAMCTFLAINTGSVQLIPATAIALLAAAGAVHPTAIVGSALIATCFSSAAGLIVVKLLEKLPRYRLPAIPGETVSRPSLTRDGDGQESVSPESVSPGETAPLPGWARGVLILFLAGFAALTAVTAFPEIIRRAPQPADAGVAGWIRLMNAVSLLAIPFLLTAFPLYAALRRVPVYEEFVEGAKEGFQVALRIIPFLVAMLVAIGFLRGAGAVAGFTELLRGPLAAVGFPPELLPLSLLRPFSGSATLAAFSDLVEAHGPDSLLARMGGTIFGSTETTFYVLAVYFGAVGVRRVRHAVWAGLAADVAGIVASVLVCRAMFG